MEEKCEFYTKRELAEKLGMSEKFVEKHQYDIRGFTKIGRSVRFLKIAVDNGILLGNLIRE